jgi:Leucine-rich repeat (LRR) protein
MRAAMKDAVKRSKGNKKKAQESKTRWKEQAKRKRRTMALLVLAVVGPLAFLCLLYPLHSLGYIRLFSPRPLAKALANPTQAEQLALPGYFLDEVPSEIEQLKKLKLLDLDSNRLQSLGDSVWKLDNLRVLKASYNSLTEISPNIGSLSNLRELHLSGNKITTLPKELFELKNLEVLVVRDNSIGKIPKEIGKLQNLKVLDLSGNQIAVVPEAITSLKSLERLSLSKNNITDLPNLAPLRRLKSLSIMQTGLVDVKVKIIRQQVGTEVTVKS